MPDLSAHAAHEYWYRYPDPMIYRVLSFMESVETWCQKSSPEFEQTLSELGEALECLGKINLDKFAQQTAFIQLGNQLPMAQTLQLLQTLDTAHPGSAAKLLMHVEAASKRSDEEAKFFLRRNITFERLRLLARVFSEERLKLILDVLDEA